MTASQGVFAYGVVEGTVDKTVLACLMSHTHVTSVALHVANGKPHIRQRLDGYNNAARISPWIVLVDLDTEADCAPALCRQWLPEPSPHMRLRVAVRTVEAWLLADRERFAKFLGVRQESLPKDPEAILHPKQEVVALARQSRRRAIREDMVPRPGSGRAVGPAYASRLIEFVSDPTRGWRPDVAAQHSDSLCRCVKSLRQLAARGGSSE